MNWDTTSAGLAGISLGEVLSILACAVFLVVALWACLPKGRPSEEQQVFDRLLHRVHERREQLFAIHQGCRSDSATRRDFLNAVRARLRQSPFFLREPRA